MTAEKTVKPLGHKWSNIPWGSRGRWFESSHSDQRSTNFDKGVCRSSFALVLSPGGMLYWIQEGDKSPFV